MSLRYVSSVGLCPMCESEVDYHEQPIIDNVPADYEEFVTTQPTGNRGRQLAPGWWAISVSGCTSCKKSTLIENARLLLKAGDDDAEDALHELAAALGITVGA